MNIKPNLTKKETMDHVVAVALTHDGILSTVTTDLIKSILKADDTNNRYQDFLERLEKARSAIADS